MRLSASVVAVLFWAGAASAEVVWYTATGTVEEAHFTDGIEIGDTLRVYWQYDMGTTDRSPVPNYGQYDMLDSAMIFEVNGVTRFRCTSVAVLTMNDGQVGDLVGIFGVGCPWSAMLDLRDETAMALTGEELVPLHLEQFTSARIELKVGLVGGFPNDLETVSSIATLTVPEPACCGIAALLALAVLRRRHVSTGRVVVTG